MFPGKLATRVVVTVWLVIKETANIAKECECLNHAARTGNEMSIVR